MACVPKMARSNHSCPSFFISFAQPASLYCEEYVRVCVCGVCVVCMCVCGVYVCVSVCMYVFIYLLFMYIRTNERMYVCTYVFFFFNLFIKHAPLPMQYYMLLLFTLHFIH